MTMTVPQTSTLEQWLPDAVVLTDLRRVIHADARARIELDSGTITIPFECEYELISKAFIEQRLDVGFGNCFRAVVAIGGVSGSDAGLIEAKYCFCTLWYSSDRKLITTDFSKEAQV